ncbi:Eukaryotic translation initiation factor 5 [Caenorhabditis elegans]|uniref:Eukaryotic translation initiation factor 5 n=1 Tax=Caenorhabditis elegans TaxID=6239 RepID=A0A1N7SYZ2_CAEEL|nr:Eukaryotic translation initiation factor 5 [Caenorhabditis elegans]SIT60446.1 Eukaryotic translation initiation factor 5 [Caenorhabditis elegans]|eukprot:NP_001335556.1 Eukaryotic translation initiation factor 5 [Caenorhabditis elegans]
MFLCPHKLAPIYNFMIDNPQEGRLSRKRKKLKICESIASSSLDASEVKIGYNSVCDSQNPHINRTRDIYHFKFQKKI